MESIPLMSMLLAATTNTAELFAICSVITDKLAKEISKEVKALIKEFVDVFSAKLPNELSPKRSVDHAIDLIPG
ncbi:18298_t:CDS:2, partial [Acaulospora morrowiae]